MTSNQIFTRSKKITLNNKLNPLFINMTENWLHDVQIQGYFDLFTNEISKQRRDDILLIGPATTQFIKSTSSFYDVLYALTSLSFDSVTYTFFCINNYTDLDVDLKKKTSKGSHWSLLVLNKRKKTFFHFDSIKGCNASHAKKIAQKINPEFKVVELLTLQQSGSSECGVHVIVNTKNILNKLLKEHILTDYDTCVNDEETSVMRGNNEFKINDLSLNVTNNDRRLLDSSHLVDSDTPSQETWMATRKNKSRRGIKSNSKIQMPKEKSSMFSQNRCTVLNSKEINKIISSEKMPLAKSKQNNNFELTENVTTTTLRKSTINQKYSKNLKSNSENQQINASMTFEHETNLEHKCERKPHVKILTDSHGRHLNALLSKDLEKYYRISSNIKPNGKLHHILDDVDSEVRHLNKDDYLIIIGGTNDLDDINCDTEVLFDHVENVLKLQTHTNIIISAVPYRYDVPQMNYYIRQFNNKLRTLTNKYSHIKFVPLYSFFYKDYTSHGLHLNLIGKQKLANLLKSYLHIRGPTLENYTIPVRITGRKHFLETPYKKRVRTI